MTVWLSVRDAVTLGVSKRTLLWRIKQGKVRSREGPEHANGRPARLVLLVDLPVEAQRKWAERNGLLAGVGNGSERDEAEAGQSGPENEENPKNILGYPESDGLDKLAGALLRFSIEERTAWFEELKRLREVLRKFEQITPRRVSSKESGGKEYTAEALAICQEAACVDPIILKREPRRAHPEPRSLERWLGRLNRYGPRGLLRAENGEGPMVKAKRERLAGGDRRRAKISPQAVKWVSENWRRYHSALYLYKAAKKVAKEEKWVLPSVTWFRRQWNKLPAPVRTMKELGMKAYTEKWAPYVPRDYSDLGALQVLCGDHSQRDVSVVLNGELVRPWLTLWQDMRTGLLWGRHLGTVPSSYTIGKAYYNGVKTWGAQPFGQPDRQSYIYTDQGKDYKSKHLVGEITVHEQVHQKAARIDGRMALVLVQRQIGMFAEADVKQLLARGYNAQEKPVERTHRTLSEGEKDLVGYCGKGTEHRPEQWRKMYAQHMKAQKRAQKNGENGSSPFMTWAEYEKWLDEWIFEYNRSEHQRVVLGGAKVVPLEEFNRLYTSPYQLSEEALSLLLLKSDVRKIGKMGVQVKGAQGHWWYYAGEMAEFKGAIVEVIYDESDYLSPVRVILPTVQGPKMVMADLQPRTSLLRADKETMQEISRRKAVERKLDRDYDLMRHARLRGITVEDQVAMEQEMEAEEEQVAMAVGENPGARVQRLTRMDRMERALKKGAKVMTAEDFKNVKGDDSIFQVEPELERPTEEWEDDWKREGTRFIED